jgi:TolB-like protein/class 3 adenylate cyclase
LSREHVERRLAAILAADVAGSCRLIGIDEEGTLAQLKALRKTLFDPKIAEHHGRVVKNTGDGALVEFASVVDAVRCADEVQRSVAEQNIDVPQDKRIEFRIGIHVGDIIIEDDDIFGDGVNIAVRLEGIAEPGGVSISDDAHRQIRGKIDIDYDDMGPQVLKNIAEPMRVWRVRIGPSSSPVMLTKPPTETAQPLTLPDKPSIAVLPFQNLSGDPEQEYFADGMVQDIITALSRFKSLFVIACNSSFTYKGKTVDFKQVGRELGVRSLLEGSVRKAGGKVRITGQLIEAATGLHLWADKFDGTLENVFELQDSVTETVAGAIGTKLREIQISLSRKAPTNRFDAYDYCLRAIAAWRPGDREEANDAALRLAYKAIELDAEYGLAYGRAANCFSARKQNRWMRNVEDETAEAMRLARLAVRWGKDDENALAAAALAFGYVGGELDTGALFAKQAVSLNPNSATAWSVSAWLHVYMGEHMLAFEHVSRAMRLSPRGLDRVNMLGVAGFAKLFLGDWNSAEQFANEAVHLSPTHLSAQRVLAASCAFQNKREEASRAVEQIMVLDPTFRLSRSSATHSSATPRRPC